MEIFEAIEGRRSIRRFEDKPVLQDLLDRVLTAATLAPSGKNRQPWKFYVVQGDKRSEMVAEMEKGIRRLEDLGISTGSAKYSMSVMAQAPVSIFVFNPESKHPLLKRDTLETYMDLVDIQSVGAAIQNMLLAAYDLGLGSLWICDVFFAYEEFCEWLGEKGELIAAVSFGYPAQAPNARPRKPIDEVTEHVT